MYIAMNGESLWKSPSVWSFQDYLCKECGKIFTQCHKIYYCNELKKTRKRECPKCGKMLCKMSVYRHTKMDAQSQEKKKSIKHIVYLYTKSTMGRGRRSLIDQSQKKPKICKDKGRGERVWGILMKKFHYFYQIMLLTWWNRRTPCCLLKLKAAAQSHGSQYERGYANSKLP